MKTLRFRILLQFFTCEKNTKLNNFFLSSKVKLSWNVASVEDFKHTLLTGFYDQSYIS